MKIFNPELCCRSAARSETVNCYLQGEDMKKVTIQQTKITHVPVVLKVEHVIQVPGWACAQSCLECGIEIDTDEEAVMVYLEDGYVRHFHRDCFDK